MRRLVFSISMMVTLLFSGTVQAAPVEFKFAIVTNAESLYAVSASYFAKRVDELSKGAMKVSLFHSGQLGKGERELIEGLQLGTVDICAVSSSPVTSYQKEFLLFNFPFLFKDINAYYNVVDGTIGAEMARTLEQHDMKLVGWWNLGMFGFTNSKRPVQNASQVKGLKIRCQENAMILAFWERLGAVPTPMSFGEVFTALQQGTVDGQDSAVAFFAGNRYQDVQKYATISGHFIMAAPVLVSKARYDGLSPEHKSIFDQAMRDAVAEQRVVYDNMLKNSIKTIKSAGMEVVETPDRESFVEATRAIYPEFTAKLPPAVGKWVQQIQAQNK